MRKIREYVVSAIAWFCGLLAFTSGSLLLLIIGIFHTGKVFEWMLKKLCRWVTFCVGIRFKIRGLENVDPRKQYVIMMNHVNLIDTFLFYPHFPGKARSVEEESHFKWPLYGLVIRRIGQFPISRKSGRKALETLKKACAAIHEKKDFSVVVMPEGTRTLTGKLGNFKKGGFVLALESGLDILPIIQIGSFHFKRKNCWLLRPGKVELVFEKPISTGEYSKKNISELMQKTRNLFLEYVD
ncbi:MAG: 1-acyl-sn-glycerol-3-phosphate acyltransferase, partial [Candidatus Aminicenantes bacterium]|nr:1-acyl-sn-glycerol-3-phosphate acyltransferase [Candidatus Aminicenantes bacterium]